MQAPAIRFDESSRRSQSDQPVGSGGVPKAIRHAAESFGLDAPSELFNEALRYAAQGHLKQARERLAMLLCLNPEDGEARLLLAKVHVVDQQWQQALDCLDQAQACGKVVPPELRKTVMQQLSEQADPKTAQLHPLIARDQGEIRSLRQEARRIRAENAALATRARELQAQTRRFALGTSVVCGLAALLVVANWALGVYTAPVATVVAGSGAQDHPATAASAPVSQGAPPDNVSLAQRASEALLAHPMLDGTTLQVAVAGGRVTLSGSVGDYHQRKQAESTLLAVSGVHQVDASAVLVHSRLHGTTHTVQSGDSLSKIAHRYYGDASQTDPIAKANLSQLGGTAHLSIGMQLVVPPLP